MVYFMYAQYIDDKHYTIRLHKSSGLDGSENNHSLNQIMQIMLAGRAVKITYLIDDIPSSKLKLG